MTTTEGETTNMGPVGRRKKIQEDDLHSKAQVYMFVGGWTAARFGLHLFDLCVIQLFQEGVSETIGKC